MERPEKDAEISSFVETIAGSQIALVGDYRGLTVRQVTALRKELKTVGASARVMKNKLAQIATKRSVGEGASVKEAELSKFLGVMKGPSLFIFSETDPVGPAKVLAKFAKGNEKFKMKGAWFEGNYIDAKGVDALSNMPGKAEVLAQLLRVIMGPATQVVRLINAPAGQVARVIEAHRQNLEKAGAAA